MRILILVWLLVLTSATDAQYTTDHGSDEQSSSLASTTCPRACFNEIKTLIDRLYKLQRSFLAFERKTRSDIEKMKEDTFHYSFYTGNPN